MGVKHACECEALLACILMDCLKQQSWEPQYLKPGNLLPLLKSSGFLEDHGDNMWTLTDKSKGLLLKYYPAQ